jgi:hypothetical protein
LPSLGECDEDKDDSGWDIAVEVAFPKLNALRVTTANNSC